MASVLRVTAPAGSLATFLDTNPPQPFPYLGIPIDNGTATAVQIEIYPHAPATQVANPTVSINGNVLPAGSVTANGNDPLVLIFFVGNLGPPTEVSGRWNAINISVQDNSGPPVLQFPQFYYYLKAPAGPIQPGPPGPPPPPSSRRRSEKKADKEES
jgi:hypothetical protein